MFDRLLQDLLQAVDVKISGSINRNNQEVRRVAVHRRPRQVAHQDIRNDLRLEVDDEHLQLVRNLVDNSDELKLSLDFAGQSVERKRFEAGGRKLTANDDTQLPAERFWAKDLVPSTSFSLSLSPGMAVSMLFSRLQRKLARAGINREPTFCDQSSCSKTDR